ncbi:MAG TPA: hypothetical protein VLJ57_18175 [Burkholderiaceae bacterium]|nr:hypothetical protein [Burkholderiaceae bacterium]
MKTKFAAFSIVVSVLLMGSGVAVTAHAQSEASALSAVSALPVASVVVGASAVAGAVVTVPVMLSTAGAVLVVKTVEITARGSLIVLERASDGARVSLELIGKGVGNVSLVAGTAVTVSVIGAGVVLSAAGEAIAFLPNALGRALLHNERLTQ